MRSRAARLGAALASALAMGACNEILGLHEGKPRLGEDGGGGAGAASANASASSADDSVSSTSTTTTLSSSSTGFGGGPWGCVGLVGPPGSADLTYQIKLSDGGNDPAAGLMAERCAASDPDCSMSLGSEAVLQNGAIEASVPASFYGYLDVTGGGYKPMLVYLGPPSNLPLPVEPVPLFSAFWFNVVLQAVGLDTEDPARGHLLVLGADCTLSPAAGLSFSASTADAQTERFYQVDADTIDAQGTETYDVGLGGFVNLPPGLAVVRLYFASDTSTPIGQAEVTIRAQSITMLRLGPTPP